MLGGGRGECKGPEVGEDLPEAETERWPLWLRSRRRGQGRAGGWPGEDGSGVKGGEL